MSEQLETIKCVDWTINFLWAASGGADVARAHLQGQKLYNLFVFFLFQRCTWTAQARSAMLPSIPSKLRDYYSKKRP